MSKIPKEEIDDPLVCEECGGTKVQTTAWVDANTNEYMSDYDGENWCEDCQIHGNLISKSEKENQKDET